MRKVFALIRGKCPSRSKVIYKIPLAMLNLASIFAIMLSLLPCNNSKILTKNQHCQVPHGNLQSIYSHSVKQCQIKFYIKSFLVNVFKDIMMGVVSLH